MLAVLCRLALEPRRAAQNGSADTGKPNYFSVRCGNRSNETHFTTEVTEVTEKQELSFWRSSDWTRSDPPRLCRRSGWILCERAVGRCCGNRSNETHFTTEAQRSRRRQGAFLLASIGLGAGLRPRRGCVAPTGLGRQSAAYPGLTPGAKLCRPFGTLHLGSLHLGVLYQQLVPIHASAADGGSATQTSMRAAQQGRCC